MISHSPLWLLALLLAPTSSPVPSDRVVLLNFWASWCGPCLEELPRLDALNDGLRADGVEATVVAVSLDRQQRRAEAVVKRLELDLPVHYDPQGELGAAWKVDVMPTSYLLDEDGEVVETLQGALDEQAVAALATRMRTLAR